MSAIVRMSLMASITLLAIALGGATQRMLAGNLMILMATIGVGAGVIAFSFAFILKLFQGRDAGFSLSRFLALSYGCLLMGAAAYFYVFFYIKFPHINDVTTNSTEPPEFRGHIITFEASEGQEFVQNRDARPYDSTFESLQKVGYPDIKPKNVPHSPDIVFRAAMLTASTMPGWRVANSEPEKLHLEAEDESETFHFIDDIAIEVRATSTGSIVEIRSRSRAGQFDFGKNAERIRAYFSKFDQSLNKILAREAAKASPGASAQATPPAVVTTAPTTTPAATPAATPPAAPAKASPQPAVTTAPPPSPAPPPGPPKNTGNALSNTVKKMVKPVEVPE